MAKKLVLNKTGGTPENETWEEDLQIQTKEEQKTWKEEKKKKERSHHLKEEENKFKK